VSVAQDHSAELDQFAVSLCGASVNVASDHPMTRALIDREIGSFFTVDDQVHAPLGTLRVHVRVAPQETLQRSHAHEEILLHDGSHSYDLRRGRRYRIRERSVVDSYDTGSIFSIDDQERTIDCFNPDPREAAIDARRIVRDQLFIPYFESLGGIVIHGAAFADNTHGIVVAGDRGSGKTSVFLAALALRRFDYFSCERTILVPEARGLRVLACPENISFFFGTLAAFPETASLVGDAPGEDWWVREKKVRQSWRKVFDAFRASPARSVVFAKAVLFPRYEGPNGPARAERLTSAKAADAIHASLVTLRDPNRPNWLGWFEPRDTSRTVGQLGSLETVHLGWSSTAELPSQLDAVVRPLFAS
jgi:hypothetical protein